MMADPEAPTMEATAKTAPAKELTIIRIYDAPREVVFNAWIDPLILQKWWGPKFFTNPLCEFDARPGGRIRVDMLSPEGHKFPMGGHFEVIEPHDRIIFITTAEEHSDGTAELENRNTVLFEDLGGKTKLTLHVKVLHASEKMAMALAGMEEGWTGSLDKLTLLLKDDNSDREIVTTRLIDAPRELVWKVWTEREHVEKWWGPNGFTTTTKEMDVRVGGHWIFTMHGPDGTDYPNDINYEELVKPERMVYLHGGGEEAPDDAQFRSFVTFEDYCGKTYLTMRAVFKTVAAMENVVKNYGAIEGAQQHVANLQEYLDTLETMKHQASGISADVVVEKTYHAPIEKVWRAITDADELRRWFFDVDHFEPRVGFEFQFSGGPPKKMLVHHCKVIVAEPLRKLAYTWRFEGYLGDSLVTFELYPEGDTTKIRFTHSGIDSFAQNPEMDPKTFAAGWNALIGKTLRTFVE
jgi:uncharacterized protein YndB with AHSA1/START domain